MRIAFVHFPGRLDRLAAARAGVGPSEFLFGAMELERSGHEVSHHEVDPGRPSGAIHRRAVDLQAGKGRLPPHLSATVLGQTRALLPRLREMEVVVATTTGTAVALATWRRLGLLRTPLVGIVAGLCNRPWSELRRRSTLPLLRSMHSVLYGPGELAGLLAFDRALERRIHVNRFGVDTSFWSPGPGTGDGAVLAIGNDGNRDWSTLVAAATDIGAPLRVLTSHPRPASLPASVSWEPADWHRRLLSDEAVRDAYRGASVVVVPVKDVPQPSGQSVTLQAMACGRPVILTRTRGLWDDRLDGGVARLVPPGDPAALAAAVRGVLADASHSIRLGEAARSWVEANAPVDGFAARLEEICKRAIAGP